MREPRGFAVGCGVAIWDARAGGFHTTVARITGRNGNTFSHRPPAEGRLHGLPDRRQAATVFPVVSGYDIEGARIERLIIDGTRDRNAPLNGCRGARHLPLPRFRDRHRGLPRAQLQRRRHQLPAVQRRAPSDGCISEDNAGLGLHPGSGSQRPLVRECVARGQRSRRPVPVLAGPARRLRGESARGQRPLRHLHRPQGLRQPACDRNQVRGNAQNGVFFRDETEGMAAHRNRLEDNLIENNGRAGEVRRHHDRWRYHRDGDPRQHHPGNRAGRDSASASASASKAGTVTLEKNRIAAPAEVEDLRR